MGAEWNSHSPHRMSLSLSPPRSAAQISWRIYLIPLAVLLTAAVLTIQFYRHFERAVAILAPLFLCSCLLLVATGLAYWLRLVRYAERRAMSEVETAAVVDQLAAGLVPRDAALIGASWRAMAIARSIATNRGGEALERVREGLRNAGAGLLIIARTRHKSRKWERVRAIYDLGWLGETDTLPVLYREVADRDDDVAWAAVVALGGMNNAVAHQALLDLLDSERFAASRIAEVLDSSSYQRSVSVLHERARTSTPRSLFWIAYLLGRSGDPAALAPLFELANHSSADVRAAVAEAFGRLGDQSAAGTLVEMARDDVWFVRLHASRSLGDLAARSSVPVLQAATHDANWWVRHSAFDSLRRLEASR
jgi:hypothetical protein